MTAEIQFHVQGPEERAIAGALLKASNLVHGDWQGVTNAAGDFVAQLSVPARYEIATSAAGFVTRTITADLRDPGTITIGLQSSSTVRQLHIEGHNFVDASGQRVVLAAIDQFRAYDRYLAGEDLQPLISESHELGAFAWRVFLMADSFMQLGPNRPLYYERLAEFARFLNSNGIILNAVLLADAQIVLPDLNDQRAHARRVQMCLFGAHVLLSLVNEYGKNGVDPGEFVQPGALLWSRGSNLSDQEPPKPYGSYVEFHPRRDIPKTIDDAVASSTYLRHTLGVTMPIYIDEPLGFAAVNEPGRRSNDPELAALLAGLYALTTAGCCFHSSNGIQSVLLDAGTRRCADAWFGSLYRCSGMLR